MRLWCKNIVTIVFIQRFLYFQNNFAHGFYNQGGVGTSSGFSTEHHCICTFQNSVCNVTYFTTVWLGPIQHTFHHLRSHYHRLSPVHTLADDIFLNNWNLFNWNFYT